MNPQNVPQRIEWHEGMLLAPQHFQQVSARLDALVAWHTLAVSPFGWGVRRLALDSALLPAGLFRVRQLEAILPDGTAVVFSADDPLHGTLDLDLAPFAAQLDAAPLDIHLVLPLSRSTRERGTPSRFRSVAGQPVEDEVSEAVAADVPPTHPPGALELASTVIGAGSDRSRATATAFPVA